MRRGRGSAPEAWGSGRSPESHERTSRTHLIVGAAAGALLLEEPDDLSGHVDIGGLLDALEARRRVDLDHKGAMTRAQDVDARHVEPHRARRPDRRAALLRRQLHLLGGAAAME